jgi:hypothetical protein
VLPIRLGIDPMERLQIAGLNGDPEFEAIEPQVFDDDANGRGMQVLRHRHDGRVDIYHQHGVKVNLECYAFSTGIAELVETTSTPADLSWLVCARLRPPARMRIRIRIAAIGECWQMAQHVAATQTEGREAVVGGLRLVAGSDSGDWPLSAS